MAEKTAKRKMLECSLAEDPGDPFLRYGLGVQCLREGDLSEGRRLLRALIADQPEDQIPAYQQLGQSYAETEEYGEAQHFLTTGIGKARVRGDWHAVSEMQQLLDTLS